MECGAVGAFLRPELEAAARVIDELSSPRVLWIEFVDDQHFGATAPQVILCGFYASPGGDEVTWYKIIQDYRLLKARYPASSFILAGDGNIHLSYILRHTSRCECLHCKQSATDKRIERALLDAGLFAYNPAKRTHVSGTREWTFSLLTAHSTCP